jgi:hypothetical protein
MNIDYTSSSFGYKLALRNVAGNARFVLIEEIAGDETVLAICKGAGFVHMYPLAYGYVSKLKEVSAVVDHTPSLLIEDLEAILKSAKGA